jgi:glycine cleavage system T protein (aminomethyltransferase)
MPSTAGAAPSAQPAPLSRTPLYESHRRAGAKLVDFAGWEMPVQYAGVIEEHRAVRSAAGLFDVSHMGEVLVKGPGAEAFLQRLTPNDVAKLQPGRSHYSALLNEHGTYLDDLIVSRLATEEFLIVVNAANAASDFAWISGQPHPGCTVEDISDRYALLALQGPHAARILQRLTALELPAIKYYRFAIGEIAGHGALVSRTGYTGEDGFEMFVEPEAAAPLWATLLESGAADGLVPAGLGARDTLRLEAGMALYGHEIDATTTPLEAGLEWTVKFDKGDFLGRATLVEQRERGVARRLVGFEVKDRGIARQGHQVLHQGEVVGAVTSGTWSPTFERALGMAYVPSELAAAGTPITLAVRAKELSAQVVEMPLYRRAK